MNKSIAKYLQLRLTVWAFVLITTIILIAGTSFYKVVSSIKSESQTVALEDAAEKMNAQLQIMLTKAEAIASNDYVRTKGVTYEKVERILKRYQQELGVNSIGFINADGYLISTDGFENDVSSREYFANFMIGKTHVNEPSYNVTTGEYIVFVGCPIYSDNDIIGAITITFKSDYFSELVSNLNNDSDYTSYLVNSAGSIIAHEDPALVENKYNVIAEADENKSLSSMADAFRKVISSDAGKIQYQDEDGVSQLVFYKKINEQNEWRLVSIIKEQTMNKESNKVIIVLLVLLVVSCTYSTVESYNIGKGLGKRINVIRDGLRSIADGNLALQFQNNTKKKDEIQEAYESMQHTMKSIRNVLLDVKNLSDSIEQKGTVLGTTAENMKVGAVTIANSINEISTGNSEQSNEINEIFRQMDDFRQSMNAVGDHMNSMNQIADVTSESLQQGRKNMEILTEVFENHIKNFEEYNKIIHNMNERIADINTITSSIQAIAGQTNLLALNAAIEAARVGEAGKGFSVVADEIRKLSEESAASVNEINEVISKVYAEGDRLYHSSKEMNEQFAIQKSTINNTVNGFQNLTADIEKMIPMIEEVFELNKAALQGAEVIGQSIENANAISEELAATSEQLALTGNHFAESSNDVNEASDTILELSEELAEQLRKFVLE